MPVFQIDQKLDSKPLVQLQESYVAVLNFETSLGVVIRGVACQKKVKGVGVEMPEM